MARPRAQARPRGSIDVVGAERWAARREPLGLPPLEMLRQRELRRELFARFLHALLLRSSEENESRRRVYVHAEPGVIALLLYGAVRLLPPANASAFSTLSVLSSIIKPLGCCTSPTT